MKLLTPDIGWAAFKDRLFWTTSAGAQWQDITPSHRPDADIADVFFLDTETGWVLFSRFDDPEPQFELASTADAGVTWSVTPVTVPDLHPESTIMAPGGVIAFADAVHGWMDLGIVSSAAFRLGLLLTTSDGGKTWNRPPRGSPAVSAAIALITPQDGWLAVLLSGNCMLRTTEEIAGNSWM